MQIIEGKDVDLIHPFPEKELHRVFGWLHCYRTLADTTNFPKTPEEFTEKLKALPTIETYGIIDKNNILGVRHEAPLIGIYMFDRDTTLNGNAHVASTRKAWGSRLVDQAGQLLIGHVLDKHPEMTRVTVTVLASNAPAKALCKRLGFTYEGCVRDAITVNGHPANMALFGLTRRDWIDLNLASVVIDPVPPGRPREYEAYEVSRG